MGKFLYKDTPNLTVMLQCQTPEVAIGRIRNALHLGADAFGLQAESLLPEYQTPEVYRKLFQEMRGKPAYVTNYRSGSNKGKTDEVLAEGLLMLADCGAALCDVQGDLFSRHPIQMTEDEAAIEKQMELIGKIHARGAEVLMSAHTNCYLPGEKVLELAMEQKRRGADIIKIVTDAADMQQQMENSYPGLTRAAMVCHRRYNMYLTTNSLLIEMGGHANTLDEAVYSGEMLGKSLVEVLKEYGKIEENKKAPA